MIQKGDEWIDAKGKPTQREYLADTFTKPEKASGKIFTHALKAKETAVQAKIEMLEIAKEYYEWLCEIKPEYKDKKSCVITSFDKSVKIEYTMKPVVRIYVYLATKENPSSGDYKRQELDFGAIDINDLLDREKVPANEKLEEHIKKNPVAPDEAFKEDVEKEVEKTAAAPEPKEELKGVENMAKAQSTDKVHGDDTQDGDVTENLKQNVESNIFKKKLEEQQKEETQKGEDAVMSGSPGVMKEEKPYKSLAEQNAEREKSVDKAVKEEREAEESSTQEENVDDGLEEAPLDGQNIEILFADGSATRKAIKLHPNSHYEKGTTSYPEIGMIVMCGDGATMAKVTSVEKIVKGAHIMRILLTAGEDLTPLTQEGMELFVYPAPEDNGESAG